MWADLGTRFNATQMPMLDKVGEVGEERSEGAREGRSGRRVGRKA